MPLSAGLDKPIVGLIRENLKLSGGRELYFVVCRCQIRSGKAFLRVGLKGRLSQTTAAFDTA